MTGLRFTAALPERGFDVSFQLAPGETLAVLGPNGAGKSTLLALVAGLLAPAEGRAELDGRVLFDVGPDRRRLTEARQRGVALLAQEALLFPHLSVLENVAFGPRSRGMGRADARSTALDWLERAGARELAERRPGQLSGGQAQRVAVARALAAEPSLLLLDEPLSALDVTVAPALRALLREVLAERMAIIVTHDPLDAYLLADRVLLLEAGRVVEAGPTGEVLTHPVTEFGARLAGLNLLRGRRTSEGFVAENGLTVPVRTGPDAFGSQVGQDASAGTGRPAPGTVPPERAAGSAGAASFRLVVRPGRVGVSLESMSSPGTACIPAVIGDVEHRGDLVRVHAAGMAADVAPTDVVALGLEPGLPVFLTVRHADADVYAVPENGGVHPDAGR